MLSPGTAPGRPAPKGWRRWWLRPVRWLLTGLGVLGRLWLVTWATLAIYYANVPWAWSRLALAVAFAAFSVWALWLTQRPRMGGVFLGLCAAVVVWEMSIPRRLTGRGGPRWRSSPGRCSTAIACASPA